MRRLTERSLLVAFLAGGGTAVGLSCSDTPPAVVCKNIPAGGCPLSHGVACDDPSCVAAYACVDQAWVLDHTCPARTDASSDAATDGPPVSDGSPVDVSVPDGAFGGPGCRDLELPDCSLGVALTCGAGASCCGCEDLFVCEAGGWTLWGTCQRGVPVPLGAVRD